jgi:hypothetical protein
MSTVCKVNLGPPFKANIINVLPELPVPQSSRSFSVVNIQRIIKIQSSRIHKHISISLESAFSNVILKRCNLILVFPINWFSHRYHSLNLDTSILLSPETFCQQSSILAPSCFVNDFLKHSRSHPMSFLANSASNMSPYLTISHLLDCWIAGLLDLWIMSQKGFKG